jgi:secondary thiamine-phosphate synthase enzyme
MAFAGGRLDVVTRGDGDVVDVTAGVARVVETSGVHHGLAAVFVIGSTAAITSMEFEPGGVADLQALLDRLVPPAGAYEHNVRNHDTNAHAHLRAAVVGPSEAIPVVDGRLALGTWQQLVLVDFDDRPRRRQILVHVVG